MGADRDALRSRCDLGQAALELGSPNYRFVGRYLEVVTVQTGSALSSASRQDLR